MQITDNAANKNLETTSENEFDVLMRSIITFHTNVISRL